MKFLRKEENNKKRLNEEIKKGEKKKRVSLQWAYDILSTLLCKRFYCNKISSIIKLIYQIIDT